MTQATHDEVVINPLAVLQRLLPTAPHRPPWTGWVAARVDSRPSPAESAHVLGVLASLARTVDKLAGEAGFNDVDLTSALSKDLISLTSTEGELTRALGTPTIAGLRNVMDRRYPPIPIARLRSLLEACDDLTDLLKAVSDDTAALARAAAVALSDVRNELDAAVSTGLLFCDLSILAERGRTLCAYGLSLQREGLGREAKLLLYLATAVIGLVPALALPAAIAAITYALADRMNEEEAIALHAAKRRLADGEND